MLEKKLSHQFSSATHNVIRKILAISALLSVIAYFALREFNIFSVESVNFSLLCFMFFIFLVDFSLGVIYRELPILTGVVKKEDKTIMYLLRLCFSLIAACFFLILIMKS